MKIVFIRPLNPFYESSASANRYEGLIKGLVELGVNIEIVVTDGYCSFNEFKNRNKIYFNNLLKVSYVYYTFNNNIWLRRLNVYVFSKFKNRIASNRLKKIVVSHNDIIWLSYNTFILDFFNNNFEIFKSQSFIELNEFNDLHEGHVKYENKLHQKMAMREDEVFKQALKKVNLIAVMTETLLVHYQPMASNNARFLHLPMTVDLGRFYEKKQSMQFQKPYIAYTGTFNNEKDGVDILIKAFIKISTKFSNLKLYLAGFYHYDIEMQKQLIAENKFDNTIIYLGALDKSEIPEFVQNAELLVMARPDSRQAQGGFPTKLGEYLATGNPVCVTSVGEIPYYLKDNISAFFAKPGDVDSFALAMENALTNFDNAKKVGLEGRKVAEQNFSISVQSSRLFGFFTQATIKQKL